MANAWKGNQTAKIVSPKNLILFVSTSLLFLAFLYLSTQTPNKNPHKRSDSITIDGSSSRPIKPFDCYNSPQAHPVFANTVEGLKFPFLYSLSDYGNLPDKPHKNIVRTFKGKPFRRPDISATVQEFLEKVRGEKDMNGIFLDVGANVGMATFAAAVMGFRVLAFEPVFENLQRICDGIYFNRVGDLVQVFEAAASDTVQNITFHKVIQILLYDSCYRNKLNSDNFQKYLNNEIGRCLLVYYRYFCPEKKITKGPVTLAESKNGPLVGRLDNSAVSAVGAKMAFKSNEEIALQVRSIPIDEVIRESERVLLLKIDVQGWEYHVLKGASKLLSRKKGEAPYLIYEEDERLLQASNTTTEEIREYLWRMGYQQCTQHGTDAHCTKTTD
ncbi:hypothetical protein OROGR_008575 [Orobanche gracilis]